MVSMDRFDIYEEIRIIISLEKNGIEDNYEAIEAISLSAIKKLKDKCLDIDEEFYHFLDDFDIRRKDEAYRASQTKKVEKLLPG
jgi:hypothetical protein